MKYLVTLKRNAVEFTSIVELENMYKRLFRRKTTLIQGIELDSIHRLHLHSLIDSKKVPYYKNYMVKGWHVYMEHIAEESVGVVIRYITKHSNKHYQEHMEISSYASYNYMFT